MNNHKYLLKVFTHKTCYTLLKLLPNNDLFRFDITEITHSYIVIYFNIRITVFVQYLLYEIKTVFEFESVRYNLLKMITMYLEFDLMMIFVSQ